MKRIPETETVLQHSKKRERNRGEKKGRIQRTKQDTKDHESGIF